MLLRQQISSYFNRYGHRCLCSYVKSCKINHYKISVDFKYKILCLRAETLMTMTTYEYN